MTDPGSLTLNEAQFLILLILLDGPLHGYGIVKEIEARTNGRVRLEPGNLYRYVRRLMGLKLVENADPVESSPRTPRQRRPFQITPLGREALIADAERMSGLVRVLRQRIADS